MKVYSIILFYICLLSSCNLAEENKDEILGNWAAISVKYNYRGDDNSPPPIFNYWQNPKNMGYSFEKDGKCQNNQGYYKAVLCGLDQGKSQFIGLETKYKLSYNNLDIYNPSFKIWQRLKVRKLIGDTLVLLNENDCEITLHKRDYSKLDQPKIVKIIYEPWISMKDKKIEFDLQNKTLDFYKKETLHYHINIKPEEYNLLIDELNKIDIRNLKEYYFSKISDTPIAKITFIYEGGTKEVLDNFFSAPLELSWFYDTLESLTELYVITKFYELK